MGDEDIPDLGPCCICETTQGVANIFLLPRRAAIPGHGWGCFVCGLGPDGASAVLCDSCVPLYQANHGALRFACRGYPAIEGRIAVSELQAPFDHDPSKHPEEID